MAVSAAVGSLGLTAAPTFQDRGCISYCFCCDFQEEAKGWPVVGLALGKIFLKQGISQFVDSVLSTHLVFNFSPSTRFVKSERKKLF